MGDSVGIEEMAGGRVVGAVEEHVKLGGEDLGRGRARGGGGRCGEEGRGEGERVGRNGNVRVKPALTRVRLSFGASHVGSLEMGGVAYRARLCCALSALLMPTVASEWRTWR